MNTEIIQLNNPNILSRDEVIGLIKKHNKIKYTLLSLLKYNIDIEPNHVNIFLQQPTEKSNYLSVIKSIENIYLSPTIRMFHPLNEIIILFYEAEHRNKNFTKKIYIKHSSNGVKNKTYKKII